MKAGDKFKMQFKDGEIVEVVVEKVFENCVDVCPIGKAIPFRKVSKQGKAFGFDCRKIDDCGAVCIECGQRADFVHKTGTDWHGTLTYYECDVCKIRLVRRGNSDLALAI